MRIEASTWAGRTCANALGGLGRPAVGDSAVVEPPHAGEIRYAQGGVADLSWTASAAGIRRPATECDMLPWDIVLCDMINELWANAGTANATVIRAVAAKVGMYLNMDDSFSKCARRWSFSRASD
jgi:hypothetical protein